MSLLAIDVGAGTQDILLYQQDVPAEGSVKMVLPSSTVIVGRRIDQATRAGKDIFLSGPTMGGGASTEAVRRHLAAGFGVYATAKAAATISDNLERVKSLGVEIMEEVPDGAQVISTGDIDTVALRRAFGLFDLELPRDVAVAVQDHGYSPQRSNRLVRFEHLTHAIRCGGTLEAFAFRQPPPAMTRIQAVHGSLAGEGFEPLLMDTGPAAVFGASLDPHRTDPCLIVNFGNGHTVAAVLDEGRILGIFEHHTCDLSPQKLRDYAQRLCAGTLKNSEIFEDGGHGAFIDCVPGPIRSTLVTGPRREPYLASDALPGAVAAAPWGDMMITGCVGLVEAWKRKERLWR